MKTDPILSSVNGFEWLAARIPFLAKWYFHTYGKRNKPIFDELKLNEANKVLVIGGGAVPHTAIRIAKEIGAEVITIDNRKTAARLAEDAIAYFSITGKIKSVHADGLFYPIKGFHVIWITLYVRPKGELLSRLLREVEPGVKIVVMRKKSLEDWWASFARKTRLPHPKAVEIGPKRWFTSFRTYLIETRFDRDRNDYGLFK